MDGEQAAAQRGTERCRKHRNPIGMIGWQEARVEWLTRMSAGPPRREEETV